MRPKAALYCATLLITKVYLPYQLMVLFPIHKEHYAILLGPIHKQHYPILLGGQGSSTTRDVKLHQAHKWLNLLAFSLPTSC